MSAVSQTVVSSATSQQSHVLLAAAKIGSIDAVVMKQFEIQIAERCGLFVLDVSLMTVAATCDNDRQVITCVV